MDSTGRYLIYLLSGCCLRGGGGPGVQHKNTLCTKIPYGEYSTLIYVLFRWWWWWSQCGAGGGSSYSIPHQWIEVSPSLD